MKNISRNPQLLDFNKVLKVKKVRKIRKGKGKSIQCTKTDIVCFLVIILFILYLYLFRTKNKKKEENLLVKHNLKMIKELNYNYFNTSKYSL